MKLPRKIEKLISDEISVYKLYVSYYFNGYFMLVPSLAPITGTGRSGPVHLLRHSARLKSVKDLEEWNSIDFPCGLVGHSACDFGFGTYISASDFAYICRMPICSFLSTR